MSTTNISNGLTAAPFTPPDAKPFAGSFLVGLIASLCCGGSLIFASIGLGAFYSALGLSRFVPQALAAGAITIVAINYFFYGRAVAHASGSAKALRRKMFISAAIGLVMMALTFIFLEWLNHAVVHADRFVSRPEFSHALVKGVPNVELLYVGATFFALAVLWALPFPYGGSAITGEDSGVTKAARMAALGIAAVLIVAAVVDASGKFGAPAGGHGAPAGGHGTPAAGQRSPDH